MGKKILITGGAGFIGSHCADTLLKYGYDVRVLDNLSSQVHGQSRKKPSYLSNDVEFCLGDVRDREAVRYALQGVDAVFHFAAAVGVGQSMYEIKQYTLVNNYGTSVLLHELAHHPVERLIVASSMSIYGEGLYRNVSGRIVHGGTRPLRQLREGKWELYDTDGSPLTPIATNEMKQPSLASIYALSKYDQEHMCLIMGTAYRIPVVALRFFNVYGPRQSLSNPYTGVLAIFASRLLNEKAPKIFEDGLQKRDFVGVHDIAQACRKALETRYNGEMRVCNIGSGKCVTILEVAHRIAQVMNKEYIKPEILGQSRIGDIRHCFADISVARRILGYEPQVSFNSGLEELAQWLGGQYVEDQVDSAHAELIQRGLTV